MKTPDDFARLIGDKQAEARKNPKPPRRIRNGRRLGPFFLGLGLLGLYDCYSTLSQARRHVPEIWYNGKFTAAAPVLITLGLFFLIAGDGSDFKFLDRAPKWVVVIGMLAIFSLSLGGALAFDAYMSALGYHSSPLF